jgi:hypothetical protein
MSNPVVAAADLSVVLVGGIAGAVTGSLCAAIITWLLAPSRAEREERGKKRMDARLAISQAIRTFHYEISEARQLAYRKTSLDPHDLEEKARLFAGAVRQSSIPLPHSEAWRLKSDVRGIVGPGVWRLSELRARDSSGTDSATLQAIADTRHWLAKSPFTPELARVEPTDKRWDNLLAKLGKLQSRYPI